MVKAIVENGIGTAILPKIIITNELKLEDLRPILVRKTQKELNPYIETNQFTLKLKHSQHYQTKLAIAFEQMAITNIPPYLYTAMPGVSCNSSFQATHHFSLCF